LKTGRPLYIILLNTIEDWGGGERWCIFAAQGLEASGHHVMIACTAISMLCQRTQSMGLNHFSIPKSGLKHVQAILQLRQYCRKHKVDAIIANVGRDLRIGAFVTMGAPTKLYQRRGLLRKVKKDPFHRWIYTRLVERIIVNCEAIKKEMLKGSSFLSPEDFAVVYNSVDIGQPKKKGQMRMRHRLAIMPDQPLVGVVGRLAPMKGHNLLIKAWRQVLDCNPKAVLLIVGHGAEEQTLKDLAKQLKLENSVIFLGFQENVDAVYEGIDVIVQPSLRDEGLNNSILESMAYSKCAVVSECGGLPELVKHENSGLVVPVGDVDKLAEALIRVLSDDQTRSRFGENARQRAKHFFSTKAMVQGIEAVLMA
jgi:glycosyltransferase involved in cell wall biosynthesis